MTISTQPRADCLVVGSGIAGVCAALFIQKAGAKVAIVDPGEPGTGASFGNAGIVVNTKIKPVFAGLTAGSLFAMLRDPASPLNVRWSQFLGLSPWFLRMLANANPEDVARITGALANLCRSGEQVYAGLWREADMGDLVRARGSLALNLSEAERDRDWDGPLAAFRAAGVPMERVGPAEIRQLAPVGARYTCGVYSPDFQHTTSPVGFVARLFESFRVQGGSHIRAHVDGVEVVAGKVAGLKTSEGVLPAGSVVLAAGIGTARLAAALGEKVPHQAVGGYHVMLGTPGIVLETPLLPLDFRFAITPMRDGIRLAGTYEFGGAARSPTKAKIDDMLRHVSAVLPGIDTTPSSTWRGFRSYLPDALPVISGSRAVDGLYYMFGFSSSGMINGAAAGLALAKLWNGDEPDFDMSPYAIDRFGSRRTKFFGVHAMTPTRRSIIGGTAALGLLPFAGRPVRAAEPLEPALLIRTTGGMFEAALKRNFFDPFTKATGVRVIPFSASYGDMMAKTAAMQAARVVEWDIISPQYNELAQISQYLTDLGDCGSLPNVAKEGVDGTCGRYGVLYLTGAQCLSWNPALYKDKVPASWADFWDTKTFPGRRALPNTGSPWATLIFALLADGVPRAELFPMDVDRAFRKLDKIKPEVTTWWRTGDQSQKMWASDDVAMSLMWSGTAYAAKQRGVPLAWTFNQAIADFGAWCILKDAPHPNAARAFLDFYLTGPERHAAFSREVGYTTSSKASQALLSADDRKDLVSSPERLAGIITVDYEWLATHRAAVLNRYNAWVSS